MGDMSELRGLITPISFIGMIVLLISLSPTEFYIDIGDSKSVDVPSYWEVMDIQNFANTWTSNIDNGTILYGLYYQNLDDGSGDFGGWDVSLFSFYNSTITLAHWSKWWVIKVGFHKLDIENIIGESQGDVLSGEEINAEYDNYGVLEYTAHCEHLEMSVFFDFNETLYGSPVEAWDSDELYILCGIHYDQTQTAYNVWEIIGLLLFFGLPNVHPVINAVISIPIWICIAYVTYILVLRTIGAVFGGGA